MDEELFECFLIPDTDDLPDVEISEDLELSIMSMSWYDDEGILHWQILPSE